MNYKKEWERISILPVEEVKIELHGIIEAIKRIPSGGTSSLNAKRLMLKLRLEKLEKRD